MTARTETDAMPLSPESREHLIGHRDELLDLSGSLEIARDELRSDAELGAPVSADTLRIIREAAELLLIAARKIDPDQETRS